MTTKPIKSYNSQQGSNNPNNVPADTINSQKKEILSKSDYLKLCIWVNNLNNKEVKIYRNGFNKGYKYGRLKG